MLILDLPFEFLLRLARVASADLLSIRVKGNPVRSPVHTYVVDASVIINSILKQHIVNESPALLPNLDGRGF